MKDFLKNEEIFGDLQINNFLDKYMVTVFEQRETLFEDSLFKEIERMGVYVDKDRLLKWLKKCAILDKIEDSELIDFATKKRIDELKSKNDEIKRELKGCKEKLRALNELLKEE